MKIFITICFILFCSLQTAAQNITVSQLSKLGEGSIAEVQENLTKNNWFFYNAEDETENKFGNAKFVFDVPNFNPKEALGKYFITYYYSTNLGSSAIDIIFKHTPLYDSLNKQMETLGYKLKDSKTKDGNIIKIYKHRGNIIEVTIPPNFEGLNVYKFLFTSKSSYKKLSN